MAGANFTALIAEDNKQTQNKIAQCLACNAKFYPAKQTAGLYCCIGCFRDGTRKPLSQCLSCGDSFRVTNGAKGLYCSYECSGHAKRSAPYSKIYTGYCIGCNGSIVSKRTKKYCGIGCYPKLSMMQPVMRCKVCEAEYKPKSNGGSPSIYCCYECKQIACGENRRKGRRLYKAKRKAIYKGVTAELVDPFKVFDRDRWMCQLCGVATPKKLRGTINPNAPELDHIQPISKGGSHTYINTQCACRKCNITKSNRPLGQTLLFG